MANPTPPLTPPQLPKSDSPTIKLVPATKAQTQQCWNFNGVSWKGPLSLDGYVRREVHLGSQELTRDGGATYWVLVDSSDKSADPIILAACETYKKTALVARRKGDSGGGQAEVETIVSHGIGSVFCRDAFRGRGYAVRMMAELRKIMESWQQEQGQKASFNVLYSDIGKKFYAKNGWIAFPSSHITLPAKTTQSSSTEGKPTTKPIYVEDLKELCEADSKQMARNIANFDFSSAKVRVAYPPNEVTMRWMHAREEFIGKELGMPSVDVKGVLVEGPVGQRVWCIWTHKFSNDPEEGVLFVSRIAIEGERSLQATANGTSDLPASPPHVQKIMACLQAAQNEAARTGLKNVEIWNPTTDIFAAAKELLPDVQLVHRQDESIPCLLWYGSEITPDELEWVGNEKYAWC